MVKEEGLQEGEIPLQVKLFVFYFLLLLFIYWIKTIWIFISFRAVTGEGGIGIIPVGGFGIFLFLFSICSIFALMSFWRGKSESRIFVIICSFILFGVWFLNFLMWNPSPFCFGDWSSFICKILYLDSIFGSFIKRISGVILIIFIGYIIFSKRIKNYLLLANRTFDDKQETSEGFPGDSKKITPLFIKIIASLNYIIVAYSLIIIAQIIYSFFISDINLFEVITFSIGIRYIITFIFSILFFFSGWGLFSGQRWSMWLNIFIFSLLALILFITLIIRFQVYTLSQLLGGFLVVIVSLLIVGYFVFDKEVKDFFLRSKVY